MGMYKYGLANIAGLCLCSDKGYFLMVTEIKVTTKILLSFRTLPLSPFSHV